MENKITYDKEADAMYIKLQDGDYDMSDEISEGIILDKTESGKLLGIEVLGVSEKMGKKDFQNLKLGI